MTNFTFELTHWNDDESKEKLQFLEVIECMFDHSKNSIPDEFIELSNSIRFGDTIEITIRKK